MKEIYIYSSIYINIFYLFIIVLMLLFIIIYKLRIGFENYVYLSCLWLE